MKGKTVICMLIALLLLTACIVTPPMITDVYRDGNDLVFHKASVQVNTLTYQVNERDGRDFRINIK
jgi:outer membrane biogenesis lipoprotein LolB